ncbi:MAG: HD domain-containing protein [Propionicimonas sp.]
MKDLVELARQIATRAHLGQRDKAGADYITHPERVARRVAERGGTAEAIAAAWLHDVVEDTTVDADELARLGVPAGVIATVLAVTKDPGHHESTEAYIARVLADPDGRLVKTADLDDNTDPARTAVLEPATRERLARKYDRVRALLAA